MLNLLMISKAFCTLSVRGFSPGSITASYLSNPFFFAMDSKSSIDFEMNDEMSLILVRILASLLRSINLSSSSYLISMLAISSAFWSSTYARASNLFSSPTYLPANSPFSSSRFSSRRRIKSPNPLSMFRNCWSFRRKISSLTCVTNDRLSSLIRFVFSISLWRS